MIAVDALRETFTEPARDIKLNLQSVLQNNTLNASQRWGVAVASAIASRNVELVTALIADARAEVPEAVIDDAKAAAVLMGMNNVYYRFRHMIHKPSYSEKPPRLRMNRLAKPSTNRTDFELYCLAVSAIHACEMCVGAHEKVVLEGGLTEEQVHDAVRIAATVHAAVYALEIRAYSAA
ncbi:MAG: carboxymuconolactone decarboxylase family protein [Deltaproteobacteria bacterium]|nr:carboxymuconolactone decarboxylase family protein [Deltaproteobacteria bacterium]